jgi:WD40 repeat protein
LRFVAATAAVFGCVAALAIWQYFLAEDRFQLALARQLTVQAQLLKAEDPTQLDLSVLLAAESMKRRPSVEADLVLRSDAFLLPRLVRRFEHEDTVDVVAFVPGSNLIATASGKSGIRIFDLAGGGVRKTIQPPDRRVEGMAFSRDGSQLWTVGYGGTVRSWNVASGTEISHFEVDDLKTNSFALFSSDGRYLITRRNDYPYLWDTSTGKPGPQPEGLVGIGIGFSEDGKYYAATARPQKEKVETQPDNEKVDLEDMEGAIVAVWETATGRRVHEVDVGKENPALGVALSPDGTYVLVSGMDGNVRVFSVDGQEQARMGHRTVITEMSVSPNGRFVGTVDDDTARIWTGADGQEILRRSSKDSFFPGRFKDKVIFSPDNRYFATISLDEINKVKDGAAVKFDLVSTVWVWDIDVSERTGFAHGGRTRGHPISSDGRYIAIADAFHDNELSVMDIGAKKVVAQFSGGARMADIAFSVDGKYLAAANWDNNVYLHAMSDDGNVAKLSHDERATAISFSPEGGSLATIGDDRTIRIWDVRTARPRQKIALNGPAHLVALGPKGAFVATVGPGEFIRILDATNGKEILAIPDAKGIGCLELSRDGKLIATASRSGRVAVWDVGTGKLVTDIKQQRSINAIAFSADRTVLATGSDDGMARVWKILIGVELVRLALGSPVGAVAFTGAGDDQLITNAEQLGPGAVIGGHVRKWPWRAADVLAYSRRGLNRNMTTQEWRRYLGDEPYRKTFPDLPVVTP